MYKIIECKHGHTSYPLIKLIIMEGKQPKITIMNDIVPRIINSCMAISWTDLYFSGSIPKNVSCINFIIYKADNIRTLNAIIPNNFIIIIDALTEA